MYSYSNITAIREFHIGISVMQFCTKYCCAVRSLTAMCTALDSQERVQALQGECEQLRERAKRYEQQAAASLSRQMEIKAQEVLLPTWPRPEPDALLSHRFPSHSLRYRSARLLSLSIHVHSIRSACSSSVLYRTATVMLCYVMLLLLQLLWPCLH